MDYCMSQRRRVVGAAILCAAVHIYCAAAHSSVTAESTFAAFESGHVRPLALSPDGRRLYAVNTPDNRLEVFRVGSSDRSRDSYDYDRGSRPVLEHKVSVPVGMEPVAVAVRNDHEVWVVNHLSDSVSVIDLRGATPRVVKTLFVGDEPRDIVFAGPGKNRAFITTAHRGQYRPLEPEFERPAQEFETPGRGRADVWVFDADQVATSANPKHLSIVTLFTDTPRALTVSADGKTVYAAGFRTGNQTTNFDEKTVCVGGQSAPACNPGGGNQAPGGLPAPNENFEGIEQPRVGLILKYNGAHWTDELGRNWDARVPFFLPDKDVFAIDATASPPREVKAYPHVGTVIFNMIVNPKNGKVYVANTDAKNEVRFEGARPPGSDVSTVQGHLHETHITVLDGNRVLPRHLNKHIDYSRSPAPAGTKEKSLALPRGMAITSDGKTLYLAAQGSNKIGVFDTAQIERNTFVPSSRNHIELSGGGPTAVVLDRSESFLFVTTRFNNSIAVVDARRRREVQKVAMYNPEPASIVQGRPFLYDARLSSSNGEASCASCHVDADEDALAWDLGNPLGAVENNPNPNHPFAPFLRPFHPLKGPMMTQPLKGLENHGPLHWRGDRTAALAGGDPFDVLGGFSRFDVGFVDLLGREAPLSKAQMNTFGKFVLQVMYPPNPNRKLDNSLTEHQAAGEHIYMTEPLDSGFAACQDCHTINEAAGLFGTNRLTSIPPGFSIDLKIPHMRNAYTKIGKFGQPKTENTVPGDDVYMGDQIRGYGFQHDGAVDTLLRFHKAPASIFVDDAQRLKVVDFLFVFPTNFKPMVGQQVTISGRSDHEARAKMNAMIDAARAGACDLIVKGAGHFRQRGWLLTNDGLFQSDRKREAPVDARELLRRTRLPGNELTFTCVPVGSGRRMGIDRDADGTPDGSEISALNID